MKYLIPIAVVGLLALPGCSGWVSKADELADSGAEKLADAYATYCDEADPGAREAVFNRFKEAVEAQGRVAPQPFDCDGDGQPDF